MRHLLPSIIRNFLFINRHRYNCSVPHLAFLPYITKPVYRMESKVWTNYPRGKRREMRKEGGKKNALESFRDERERAFRRMVHYQGQYPGCSTTLLTISPNCYTLYLPHSTLSSSFSLSLPPFSIYLPRSRSFSGGALSPPSATITPRAGVSSRLAIAD